MRPLFQRTDLDGSPFFWRAGQVGVLLIHGFTATPVEVRPLAEFLLSFGYSVCAPLLPGHGLQPDDLNQVHWEQWLDEANKGLSTLRMHCKRVICGGESAGALIALLLASRYPEIEAILAFAPALKTRRSNIAHLIAYLFSPWVKWIDKPYDDFDAPWQGYTVYPLTGLRQLFRLQARVRSILKQVQQPCLIVQGRRDQSVDPRVPALLVDGLASRIIEIHWFERSGHTIILDAERTDVYKTTLDFLQRIVG